MTTEELKRAFDICLDTHGCTGCPLLALEQQNGCDCRHNLFVSAIDLATEQEREIAQLKDENIRLRGKLAQVLLSINTVKEMNAMCDIDDQRKQAVKEFAGKIKAKLNAIFGKTICSDLDTEDITDIIDELLKEYENGKDKD